MSEIHALASDSHHCQFRADGSVQLLTQPGFVAKNRLPSLGNQSAVIKPLPLSQDNEERWHDPVRALRIYLDRSMEVRDSSTRLFLPLCKSKSDITAQAISGWLKSVVKEAYRELGDSCSANFAPKAHDIRAVATSLSFQRNIAAKEIIQAVGWQSWSTFGSFYMYLRDCSEFAEEIDKLGPVTNFKASYVTLCFCRQCTVSFITFQVNVWHWRSDSVFF